MCENDNNGGYGEIGLRELGWIYRIWQALYISVSIRHPQPVERELLGSFVLRQISDSFCIFATLKRPHSSAFISFFRPHFRIFGPHFSASSGRILQHLRAAFLSIFRPHSSAFWRRLQASFIWPHREHFNARPSFNQFKLLRLMEINVSIVLFI